jgi:hypothetical protein
MAEPHRARIQYLGSIASVNGYFLPLLQGLDSERTFTSVMRAKTSINEEVSALVSELEAAWTEPYQGPSKTTRKLTKEAALDIVRRLAEGLDQARALAPWRITPGNLAVWFEKADEEREPYATFCHYFARAQNILRGRLITDIADGGDIKAKIELLRATTPEFSPQPAETVFNLRPQFRGALDGKTVVNVLPDLPPYQPPPEEKDEDH